jgi:two-component system response regulator GlrR
VGNVIAFEGVFLGNTGYADFDVREILPMTRGIPPRLALVVDDEALIRWSVSEGLTEAGWTVRQAATGADARQAVRAMADTFFVIVLDLRLPDVADLSLMREIRTVRPDVPMIVMTAHGTAEDALEARASGVFSFVSKPFDVPSLVALANTAAERAEQI